MLTVLLEHTHTRTHTYIHTHALKSRVHLPLYLISFRFTFTLLTGKCSYPFAVNFKLQFAAQGGREAKKKKQVARYEL